MTGMVCGIVMGRVADAMMITAAIQLIYMGMIAPGGSMPSEPAVAASIAVPVSLMAGLGPQEAIAVAVPVGLMGSYLYSFRLFLNSVILRWTDKYVSNMDDRGLTITIIVIPIIIAFLLFFPLIFLSLYLGAPVVAAFISQYSGGIIFHTLGVIGGGLAALGIALIMKVIGKQQFIIFFLLAYFMAVIFKPLNVNTVVFAIFGAILAYLYTIFANDAN
jgi:PTS system mannose-specific IIC component